jgi:hypothetical protein
MFRPLSRRLGALLLCSSLLLGASTSLAAPPAAPAKAKPKKKGPVGAKNAALSNALNEKGEAVQKCAIENGLEKGGKKAEVAVRVTINKQGGVVDTQITAKVDGAANDAVRDCVEKLVRTAKFPAVPTPLATSERAWTVASQ